MRLLSGMFGGGGNGAEGVRSHSSGLPGGRPSATAADISAQIAVLSEVQRWVQSNFRGRALTTETDYATDHSMASEIVTYLDDKIAALKIEARKQAAKAAEHETLRRVA